MSLNRKDPTTPFNLNGILNGVSQAWVRSDHPRKFLIENRITLAPYLATDVVDFLTPQIAAISNEIESCIFFKIDGTLEFYLKVQYTGPDITTPPDTFTILNLPENLRSFIFDNYAPASPYQNATIEAPAGIFDWDSVYLSTTGELRIANFFVSTGAPLHPLFNQSIIYIKITMLPYFLRTD